MILVILMNNNHLLTSPNTLMDNNHSITSSNIYYLLIFHLYYGSYIVVDDAVVYYGLYIVVDELFLFV